MGSLQVSSSVTLGLLFQLPQPETRNAQVAGAGATVRGEQGLLLLPLQSRFSQRAAIKKKKKPESGCWAEGHAPELSALLVASFQQREMLSFPLLRVNNMCKATFTAPGENLGSKEIALADTEGKFLIVLESLHRFSFLQLSAVTKLCSPAFPLPPPR